MNTQPACLARSTLRPNQLSVVLFTQRYPFGEGEQFLTAELDVLSRLGCQLIVVPTVGVRQGENPRPLPTGTTLIAPSRAPSVSSGILWALRKPLSFARLLQKVLVTRITLDRKLEELRFNLIARITADDVVGRVASAIEGQRRTLLYGYWLHIPAAVAVHLKKFYPAFSDSYVISRAHGFDIYPERNPNGYLPQRRELFETSLVVYSASLAGANYLAENWPEFKGKFAVSHLGVTPASNIRNVRRASRHIVSCSYIYKVKRLDRLIDAIAVLQSTGATVRWTHIGPVDTEYAKGIREHAANVLKPGSFNFIGGLPNTDVRKWLSVNSVTVFVNVSESEGVPVSVMEAMAQGIPIVATDVGGNSELFDLSRGMFDGLLPSNAMPEDIAAKLEEIFKTDDATYADYARASHDVWQSRWAAARNYESFLCDLLNRANS